MISRKLTNIFKIEAQMKVNDVAKTFHLRRQHIIISATHKFKSVEFASFAAKTKETLKKKIKILKKKFLTVEKESMSLQKKLKK